MLVQEIVFTDEKIEDLIDNINTLCIKCDYIGKHCNICSIEEAKVLIKELNLKPEIIDKLKSYNLIIGELDDSESEIEFNKNNVLLTQNSIETICENCNYLGSYCLDCNIHQIRRLVASLPLQEIEMFNPVKEKKSTSSGGSCGTSCSTGGCSTKKKKK
jgi:hypothetical protein